nr:unnamed protein product [Callosobruchus chinensis]
MVSDECRFGLVSDDYRERVWRKRGGQNRLATAIGVAPYGGGTQMFWGGIRLNGRTQLIHIPGTMTGAYYLHFKTRQKVLRTEIYLKRRLRALLNKARQANFYRLYKAIDIMANGNAEILIR